MSKKIDFDTQLYDAMLSVDYFARLMAAYKHYRNERIIANRNDTMTDQEQLSTKERIREGIKSLWEKVKNRKDTPDDWWLVRPAVEAKYITLEKLGIIQYDDQEKWDIYDEAKKQWLKEIEKDEAQAMIRMDRHSVTMLRQIMTEFEANVIDTTHKGHIQQIARILSLKKWMYELRDNNKELPKLF